MIEPKRKKCDICNITVAQKNCMLYYTVIPYITIKSNIIDEEGYTEQKDLHICNLCWKRIKEQLTLKKGE